MKALIPGYEFNNNMIMQRDCFFTSIALNYLPKALALATSVFEIYPSSRFIVSLIDHQRLSENQLGKLQKLVKEFDCRGHHLSFFDPLSLYNRSDLLLYKFDVVEACTSVKPAVAKALLELAETVTYLDPDTILYSRLPEETGDNWEFQVTPHVVTPSGANSLISERLFMFYGVFNLGYFAVRRSSQTLEFLNWWKNFCLDYGAKAPHAGLFVDQKPVDLLPCFVDRVNVIRHPGCNVAWWNIFCDDRRVEDGKLINFNDQKWQLIFYHFSNLHNVSDPGKRMIANPLGIHKDRKGDVSVLLAEYPALADLFAEYELRTQTFLVRCKEISKESDLNRITPPKIVRILLSEALRRGMQYPNDPAKQRPIIVGWRSLKYIVSKTSPRDAKIAITSIVSMVYLALAVSLLRFTK